jgi:hypothetical protein
VRTFLTHALAAIVAGGLVWLLALQRPEPPDEPALGIPFDVLSQGKYVVRNQGDRVRTAVIYNRAGMAEFLAAYPDACLNAPVDLFPDRLLVVGFSDTALGVSADGFREVSAGLYCLDLLPLQIRYRRLRPPSGKKYSAYCVIATDAPVSIAGVGVRDGAAGLCKQYGKLKPEGGRTPAAKK